MIRAHHAYVVIFACLTIQYSKHPTCSQYLVFIQRHILQCQRACHLQFPVFLIVYDIYGYFKVSLRNSLILFCISVMNFEFQTL